MARARAPSGAGIAFACPNDDERFGLTGRERDRPLSFHWRVDEAAMLSLGLPSPRHRVHAARNAILTEAVLANEEGHWVSFSRRRAFYANQTRYRGTAFTYDTVVPTVDDLVGRGLLEEDRATPGTRGWQSRFRATPELVNVMAGAAAMFEMRAPIQLKDAQGRLIDFRETGATRRMHTEIAALNTYLASFDVGLSGHDVVRSRNHLYVDGLAYRPAATSLYRVFNRASFSYGGRAYGWWQSLSKARRGAFLIDGEKVAEPDFMQMHASILSAQRGEVLAHDPYETGDWLTIGTGIRVAKRGSTRVRIIEAPP